jgi:anti-sigma regulatory factor (Ser/Thr protein kinase)
MTTLVYLVLDPAAESLELVSAGHPPALVIAPSGAASYLQTEGGVALGATPTATYRSERFPLPTGSTVFLYTDGLVERRGESIDVGLERLRALAANATGDVEALCATVVDELVPDAPPDDVAFVAARVPPLSDSLSTRWPATTSSLPTIRHLLRRWLVGLGATEDEVYDIIVACQEACANAVEHAYGPARALFEVAASHDGGLVRLTVSDRGRWRAPRGDNRGRGIPLMRALMDTVDVRHTDDGTAVTLARHLGAAGA